MQANMTATEAKAIFESDLDYATDEDGRVLWIAYYLPNPNMVRNAHEDMVRHILCSRYW